MRAVMVGLFSITKVSCGLLLGTIAMLMLASSLPSNASSSLHAIEPEREAQLAFVAANPASKFLRSPKSLRRFAGVVRAARNSTVAAQAAGRVEKVHVQIGQFVTSGQKLVELDQITLRASVMRAQAELASAKAQLKKLRTGPRKNEIARAAALVDEARANVGMCQAEYDRVSSVDRAGVISPRDLDNARFALSAAESTLEAAKLSHQLMVEGMREEDVLAQQSVVYAAEATLNRCQHELDNATTLAPFDGFVQSRLVEKGEVVQPGQPLVELVENVLQVHVALPPSSAESLSTGSAAAIVRIGEKELPSTLLALAPALNETTGTRLAKLSLDRSELDVAVGESADVLIQNTHGESGTWIPNQALSSQRGAWTIFQASPTGNSSVFRVEAISVNVLKTDANFSKIDADIQPEQLILTEGLHRVAPGQLVHVLNSSSEF